MLRILDQLAQLVTANPANTGAAPVAHACDLVRQALSADDASIIRAGDPNFVRLGSDADPATYEIKQKGYYLIWQALATNPALAAGGVRVANRLVEHASPLYPGFQPTHLACILPGYESNSDLLVVRGSWPDGLTADQIAFVTIARPLLATLVAGVLDAERRARQHRQLGLFADVATAFSEARQMDGVLAAIATAAAKAAGFDFASIALFDESLERVVDRATNLNRFSKTATAAEFWTQDEAAWAVTLQHMDRTGRPVLAPNVFTADWTQLGGLPPDVPPDHPEVQAYIANLLRFYERSHILSTAMFPIRFQERTLGIIFFSDTTPHAFDADEVDLLTALVAQAAAGIGGMRLHEELCRANASLAFMAGHDPLTSLPNRRLFAERIEQSLATLTDGEGAALLYLDLDGFKLVNDRLGHEVGDQVLQLVAAQLSMALPEEVLAARLGGDEFAVLLPSTPEVDALPHAEATARHILARLREPLVLAGERLTITASIGIAVAPTHGRGVMALLRHADATMYTAKTAGRNTYCSFTLVTPDPMRQAG